MNRCAWVNPKNELYVKYHDEEWGVPVHDDNKLFEFLILEGAQAGLSWETILKRRETVLCTCESSPSMTPYNCFVQIMHLLFHL